LTKRIDKSIFNKKNLNKIQCQLTKNSSTTTSK